MKGKPTKQKVEWMKNLRAARQYIIHFPGRTTAEVFKHCQVGVSRLGLGYLQRMKLIKRVKGTWWPVEAPEEPVDFGPTHGKDFVRGDGKRT